MKRIVFTAIALVVVSIVIGAAVYDRIPDRMPTHFDLHGRPHGFTAKLFGVFVTPAVIAILGLVFSVLPRISPKGYRMEPFLPTYEIIAIAVLVMFFADMMAALGFALGYGFDMNRIIAVGTGLLFVVLGNYLGKVTRNFFVGIRTPWTLASDEVWLRTHRLGGVLFVIGGAILVIAGFVRTAGLPFVLLGIVLPISLFLVLYSYVVYRQIENGNSDQPL